MLSQVYELRCADESLLSFSFVEDELGTPSTRIIDINEELLDIFPWGLEVTDEGLYSWLQRRSLPQNRRFASELCRAMGIRMGDVEQIFEACMGLSLNDCYWTPKRGFEASFDEVNLYENGFSAVLAAVACTGHVPAGASGSMHGLTPELTTDGLLRKAWRAVGSERWLFKGASEGWHPGEPASEVISSFVARSIGVDAVVYGAQMWEGELCSTCACFCSKEVSYAPFAVATGSTSLAGALWWASRLDRDGLEKLADMLVFDALIANPDRHFTNFGVLRDVASGRPLGLAPVFDSGCGLLPMLPNDMLSESAYQEAAMGPAFGGATFRELAGRVMGDRQRKMLVAASALDLGGAVEVIEDPAVARMLSERLPGMEEVLHRRATELLELAPVNREELTAALGRAHARTPFDAGGTALRALR